LYFVVHPTDAPKGYLQVRGNVNNPVNMSVSDIQAMPSVNLTARLTSTGSPQENGDFNYTGVTLWDLLVKAGVSDNATSVRVVATDAYSAQLQSKS
jgi:DMSO/TMAO reductase YedYZ molybdopterin-dependent catalytic subunit